MGLKQREKQIKKVSDILKSHGIIIDMGINKQNDVIEGTFFKFVYNGKIIIDLTDAEIDMYELDRVEEMSKAKESKKNH